MEYQQTVFKLTIYGADLTVAFQTGEFYSQFSCQEGGEKKKNVHKSRYYSYC